jgi:hypothetical protein
MGAAMQSGRVLSGSKLAAMGASHAGANLAERGPAAEAERIWPGPRILPHGSNVNDLLPMDR